METKMQQCIGNNLKYLRTLFGYTQKEVAHLLHISLSTYGMVELGHRAARTDLLIRLAKLYQIPMDVLFESDYDIFIKRVNFTGSRDITELVRLFHKLSPFAKGCLLERASVLLTDENSKKQTK